MMEKKQQKAASINEATQYSRNFMAARMTSGAFRVARGGDCGAGAVAHEAWPRPGIDEAEPA